MTTESAIKHGFLRKAVDVTPEAWEAIKEAKRITGKTLKRCQCEAYLLYLKEVKRQAKERE